MTPENEKRHPLEAEVLSLFPIPFYTGRGIYFEEDLKEAGLTRALEQVSFETARIILESAQMLASIKPELAFYFLLQASELLNCKRRFEWIRQDQILLRRQKEGDEVDLDSAVEALSDMKAGHTPSERVFIRLNRQHRDIATAFLIDLSGSTSGWINETERMALLILCEAMDQIEDRFAIYGFSGQTRKRCELFRIKGFEEAYGDRIKKRIAGIRAREYTRMGPPIRRLTEILGEVDARSKLLLTLSDGKPDDYDAYSGDYGIEDTRQALVETRKQGIYPFCITIDKAEHSYLAHMYGHTGYVFIDNLAKLPLKIPEIYRKLTT